MWVSRPPATLRRGMAAAAPSETPPELGLLADLDPDHAAQVALGKPSGLARRGWTKGSPPRQHVVDQRVGEPPEPAQLAHVQDGQPAQLGHGLAPD